MWVLDPVNSAELLVQLRPHALSPDFDLVWCGEGWRALVAACHRDLVRALPEYRFADIKQKHGVLMFQPVAVDANEAASAQSQADAITSKYLELSEVTCEWCGGSGRLHEAVPMLGALEDLTLCEQCRSDLNGSPYPSKRPPS